MQCLPAIDIRGGRAVRLLRGDFAAETIFGDPLEQAERFVQAGAPALHIVDLDAARTGEPVNRGLVCSIISRVGVPVQVGGGVRSAEDVELLLGAGAWRVVLGTVGLADPDLTASLAKAHPGQIALGLDHRRISHGAKEEREVSVRGWEQESGVTLEEALGEFQDVPLGAVIVTDITKDGTLEGPDLEGYALVLATSALPIVASGGIGDLEHLRALSRLEVGGRRLSAVVVGRALLSGAMSVGEAVAACAP